ncbi:MAG: zinc-binding dehydrogenase, partial [Anaerolineales bacterium]|nr:zinc-binding dehydrogenase [Anaerolineales bacterium]
MTMTALVFTQHGRLTPETVHLQEMPIPTPKADEVLVEIKAAALNRLDLWVLAGWPSLRLDLPHIMGSDGAGVITAVGENVKEWAIGDRVALNPGLSCGQCAYCLRGQDNRCVRFAVLGEHVPGLFARYQAVPARNLLALPEGVSFATAAAATLVTITAWHSLITAGGLRAGEEVLIVGAGGGVNTAAIQIAKLAGAKTVYVVGSDDEKLGRAQALGADVLLNRQRENWSKAIYQLTNKRGVDIVVDNVGAATYPDSLRALGRGGRLLTVGNTSGPTVQIDNRLLFGKHLSLIGSTMATRQDFLTAMEMVFHGRVQAVIDTIYPL